MNRLPVSLLILLLAVLAVFSSCKKDSEEITGFGDLEIEFDNRAGDRALVLGTEYETANGQKVTFSKFDYYVSNFVLVKEDGSEYVVPKDDCYFLCKHDNPTTRLVKFENVPAGDYHMVRFIIGVDSLKSAAPIGERTGVLDPVTGAAGMYWMWNSGYIFAKIEGTSPSAPLDPNTGENTFQYHIGGFGGYSSPTINNIKTVMLHSHHGEVAKVRENEHGPHLHVYVDVLEAFTNPTNLDLSTNPKAHFVPFSTTIADNYADMFELDHIH